MGWGNPNEDQVDDSHDEVEASGASDATDTSTIGASGREEQPCEASVDYEDSDSIADDSHAHAPNTPSERRRAQNEILRAYANRRAEQVTEEEIKEGKRNKEDEELSIRDILARADNSARIANPRDYQTELFQRARDENVIAVLDTGTGKTHIATLLLRFVLDNELEARANGRPHKIAFFLVDSVNLVFQQANVLRCGLDQKVEGICGAMGAGLWQKAKWGDLLKENMVIICTAEVLVQCMMHSFVAMAQVNILIFDEAHHAKSNHPYARLMKDYYLHEPDVTKRPRVFGMTASPVDADTNIREAAKKLEKLLDCRIVTASEDTLNRNNIARPREEVASYAILHFPFDTPFNQQVKARYGDLEGFRKLFATSGRLSCELGRWASDKYWSFALSDEESRKHERKKELQYNKDENDRKIERLDSEIARLKEATSFVQKHDFGLPTLNLEDLSSKVMLLKDLLDKYYCRSDEARCIVFVEQRQTARLLHLVFAHLGGPNLHTDFLFGASSRSGEYNVSLRNQVLTVQKFRQGKLNCLFSTSVAEEGLDIPQCNLVVRFDLYRTMIAYVQSRGRARHKNSTYVHMVELNNLEHRELMFKARQAEYTMRKFCEGLPQDRFLDGIDLHVNGIREDEGETYIDPDSGAKLTYRSSLSVLAHFVACIPVTGQEVILQATYVLSRVYSGVGSEGRNGWQCEVILPACLPVTFAVGKTCGKKALAKCSAAFKICLELRDKGFLDEHLLPTYQKKLPTMRNAHLALTEKKDNYSMRVKPDFWQIEYGKHPQHLYMTVIDVAAGLERPHQPLGLLTRSPLPKLPSFPIYLNDGRPSDVVMTSFSTALVATDELLELFTKVTLGMYADIYNKIYEEDLSKMSYWLVPVRSECAASVPCSSDPMGVIDMDQVLDICNPSETRTQWTPAMENDYLTDKYIVDKFDGGRRFYSYGVTLGLRPADPVPESVLALHPKRKYHDNILDFSNSLWSRSRKHFTWDKSQPVIEVERIPFRRNFLAAVEQDEQDVISKPIAYVCPQPLSISMLSTRFVAMCYVFPAIIHRIEDCLIALEACEHLGLNLNPAIALEALTKDSENSGKHGEEIINFRSGMGPNYERLEFLGDCFLKMATSLSTFVQQPDENEFEFHVRRMCMICNKNLFATAQELKLYEYIRTMAFNRRQWYPKGLNLIRGKATGDQTVYRQLGDKSIADVCEAFIGAVFLQDNRRGEWNPRDWNQAVKAVKIFVSSEDHVMETYSDYYAAYVKPKYQTAEATATQLDLAEKVEKKHPYHFQYPRLLRSAFLHPSQAFMWEKVPNYQRLEFLGDSLLDLAFIMHLFYNYPNKDPQWLTEHKNPMVSNRFLGAVCAKLGFHTHIRQNSAVLSSEIRNYVTDVEEAEREANGAVDYWTTVDDPPKCLADVVEAYVAAIFVDSEFNFQVVQDFFDMHLKRYFVDMTLPSYEALGNRHPVTRLQYLMTTNFRCDQYRLSYMESPSALPGVSSQGVAMLLIHGKVYFDSLGQSARYGKPRVASKALEALEGLPQYQYRQKYGCDCKHNRTYDDEDGLKAAEERIRDAVGSAF